jgi:glyoxylase-like metal-dependent hydrolase (beta-lactamase superfamily II)
VERIVLTHRHPDHTAGAARLSELAGAPVLAFGAGLSDGDVVGGLVAAHTPGHAPEHLCFWHPESRTLLSGDLIAGEGSIMISPPEGDLREYVASLERVRGLSPSRILPGHGPEVARAGEKIEEYLAHRREREARVVAALDSGARSLTEVVESAYADVPPPMRPYAELSAKAHLLKLRRQIRS